MKISEMSQEFYLAFGTAWCMASTDNLEDFRDLYCAGHEL